MTSPVAPIASALPVVAMLQPPQAGSATGGPAAASFSQFLLSGINDANSKVLDADNAVRSFALDDSIPVHQVTFALEQARLSLELMMQLRGRLVDAYQQLMNMQP